jgi:hypothetical protein
MEDKNMGRWKDNIKIVGDDVDWIHVTQDRHWRRARVKMVMNL